ncbi:hypothetical protein X566_15400 [Afipia sp. P52-10]|uniref:DUF3486 family protein n=1 Tax=Afipia sp. P52-10 TaxID=1429916 RepID=UPI0003DF3F37|nr:DUF3486 family protein [Afipia sp. P52-10]ETR78881.1 hypothetical protein X566_15400 [Afipia sp. P52-10]
MADRAKRGRLSAIDTLPEWADEAKVWAFEQLKERKLSQLDILDGFNARLKVAALANGITDPPVISRSAFNRTALRIAIMSRRLEETRQIAAVIAPKLEEAGDESLTLMVAETLKTLIAEMLGNAGELSADGDTAMMLMATSRALKHAEEAKRISADGRRKIEADLKAKAVKAVDQVAKQKGLSAETVADIRSKILGIDKPEARP